MNIDPTNAADVRFLLGVMRARSANEVELRPGGPITDLLAPMLAVCERWLAHLDAPQRAEVLVERGPRVVVRVPAPPGERPSLSEPGPALLCSWSTEHPGAPCESEPRGPHCETCPMRDAP